MKTYGGANEYVHVFLTSAQVFGGDFVAKGKKDLNLVPL
jgi:hypothetical protein